MAMNKRERELVASLLRSLSLRITETVQPDLKPPIISGIVKTGFVFNAFNSKIEAATSGQYSTRFFDTNGNVARTEHDATSLYSTKLLCLRGLRNAVEKRCAEQLRKIDDLIDAEKALT